MSAVMENLKDMVNVNTVVGESVEAPDGTVIIPASNVAFGFIAGGGEINFGNKKDELSLNDEDQGNKFPFTGGSGAGVSIKPVAFMVAGKENVKLLSVNSNSKLDKILDSNKRTLNSLEVAYIYQTLEVNVFGMQLMTGFAQAAKESEFKKYFVNGKELAKKIVVDFSSILLERKRWILQGKAAN